MFDTKAEIGLPLQTDEGVKKVVVRYPSDEEWTEWRGKKKVTQTDIGRGKFELQPSKPEKCDVALANAIRVDKEGPAIDQFEALEIVERLAATEVTEQPERSGNAFAIRMKVMHKLMTSHTLRVPSVKEKMEYGRSRSAVIFEQYGRQQIKINFLAAAELYDKLKISSTGYANNGVPVTHKQAAVNVLLQELDQQQQSLDGPEEDEDQD